MTVIGHTQSVDHQSDVKVIKNVKKEKSKIFSFAPGSWQLLGPLPIIGSRECNTFATNGQHIIVNPDFAITLNPLEIRGTLLHEEEHVSKRHHLRRGDRLPLAWNYACDYQINGELYRGTGYGTLYLLPEGFLYDHMYSTCNWSVEKIYNDMIQKGWEEPPDSEGSGTGGGTGGGGCGEVLDSPNASDPEENQREQQEIMERVRDAQLLEKAMGVGKGSLKDKINGESERSTASSEVIRRFLQKTFAQTRSFRRPNKRFLSKNILMPSRTKVVKDLYVAIDSSASVGITEFEQYRKNLIRWANELKLQKLHVAYVDSRIHNNPDTGQPWFTIDLTSGKGADAMELDIHGGGGTSFDPIFQHIRDENESHKIGALVYFTDGYGYVEEVVSVPYPVLWITSAVAPQFLDGSGEYCSGFGTVIEI